MRKKEIINSNFDLLTNRLSNLSNVPLKLCCNKRNKRNVARFKNLNCVASSYTVAGVKQ